MSSANRISKVRREVGVDVRAGRDEKHDVDTDCLDRLVVKRIVLCGFPHINFKRMCPMNMCNAIKCQRT